MHAIENQFDRLPPHSIEAEMCLLASMMLANDPVLFHETRAGTTRGSFFQSDHAIIFSAICDLHDRAGKVDAVLLREELKRRDILEEIGGVSYIAQILQGVPSASHGPHYAAIVRDRHKKRQLIAAANDVLRGAYAPFTADNADEMCQEAAARFSGICTDGERGPEVYTLGDVMAEVHGQLERGDRPCVMTGFRDLDEKTGGIQWGEEIIVAARPSVGKSTLGKQIALRAAMGAGTKVGIISNEEGRFKIGRNLLSSVTDIENRKLRDGRGFDAADWQNIAGGVAKLGALPIWVREKASNIRTVRAAASYMAAKGCKLLIIDYLQRIGGGRGDSRYSQVSDVSLAVSDLIKELDVAGIVLAQLNRGVEGRDEKRPGMKDLRDSGQIEQDADGIIFLHREDYYRVTDNARKNEPLDGKAELAIAKWRDGVRGGCVELKASMKYQRFEDWDGTTFDDPFDSGRAV